MRLGPLLSVYFQWVSICGSCPLAEFTGWTRVVVLSFNAVIKRAVFVSLSKFSLKWVTAATFTRSFRVLSWKKHISGDICFIFNRFYRSYLNSESVNWCVALKLCYLLGVKNKLRTSPQIRILVLLRGSFQNFSVTSNLPPPPSSFFWYGWIKVYKSADPWYFFRQTRGSAKIFVYVRNCIVWEIPVAYFHPNRI